jgi:class 3 adenylate cyclase
VAPRGLAFLASFDVAPELQRWIVGIAILPLAILCAVAFCPINDMAVTLSRRFGAGFVSLCEEIRRRLARQNHPQALIPKCSHSGEVRPHHPAIAGPSDLRLLARGEHLVAALAVRAQCSGGVSLHCRGSKRSRDGQKGDQSTNRNVEHCFFPLDHGARTPTYRYANALLPSSHGGPCAPKQGLHWMRNSFMVEERVNRRLAAVLAADVVGYSRLMEGDEAGTLAALKRHREAIFDPAVIAHNGRIVKLIGDGVIAEFGSVVDAVNCALWVQRAGASTLDQSATQSTIVVRIGINLGDVIIEGDDIYGDGVNIAGLEPLAEPGGVCVSSIVNESVGNRIDVRFSDSGEISVKNIDRPIRIWKWHPSTTPDLAKPTGKKQEPNVATASIAILPFTNMSGDPEQVGRHHRRHHHRPVEDRGPDGDRTQLKLYVQGPFRRHSRSRQGARRAFCA